MGMTRDMIEITFGNALTQAKQLDECAESLEQLANNSLSSVQSDLSAAWQGDSADTYFSKMNLTRENIRKTAEDIQSIADTLRQVARIFRESELKALEIATSRTY